MAKKSKTQDLIHEVAAYKATIERVFRDYKTHRALKVALGEVWDDAVELLGTPKAAAEFMLDRTPEFDGRSAAEAILSGEEGFQQYQTVLSRRELTNLRHDN